MDHNLVHFNVGGGEIISIHEALLNEFANDWSILTKHSHVHKRQYKSGYKDESKETIEQHLIKPCFKCPHPARQAAPIATACVFRGLWH